MTRWIAIGAAVAFVAGSVYAWAADGRNQGGVDKQSFAWTTDDTTVSGTRWTRVRDLSVTTGCPGTNPATATASVVVSGGAGALRVELDDPTSECIDCPGPEGVMRPGGVPFDAGRRSLSFTFVAGNPPGGHGTTFRVQLRPAGETPVTIHKGSLSVLWNDLEGACI